MPIRNLFKYWTSKIFTPDGIARNQYKAFMSLLTNNKKAHTLMAEFEDIYYRQVAVDITRVTEKYNELSLTVSDIIDDIQIIAGNGMESLRPYFNKIDTYARYLFDDGIPDISGPWTLSLKSKEAKEPSLSGGKALNLSKICQGPGFPVPEGFVITTRAFNAFFDENDLRDKIDILLSGLDMDTPDAVHQTADRIKTLIDKAHVPPFIIEDIQNRIKSIWPENEKNIKFAVRSSAVGEDSTLSFAGQYRSVLDCRPEAIISAYKKVIASKYSHRALFYRINCGLSDLETQMAVLVIEMVDAGVSGVIYTDDPLDPDSNRIVIHSVKGTGEALLDGRVASEKIYISKNRIPPISGKEAFRIHTRDRKETKRLLRDEHVDFIARYGLALEDFFQTPQDIEWCLDKDGQFFLLQSRPLQTVSIEASRPLDCRLESIPAPVLVSGGEIACHGIGSGPVFHAKTKTDVHAIPRGCVLVATNASPDLVQILDRVAAVITLKGSSAGHFASVAREFGVPVLVNMPKVFDALSPSTIVTVDTHNKNIYEGRIQEMLESPCARIRPITNSPFMRRMAYMISFVSPLALIDPEADNFNPGGCRSLQDVIRFCHETALKKMFHLSDKRWLKTGGTQKLETEIPMKFNILDVGGGVIDDAKKKKTIGMKEIVSIPMVAVLKGLLHPDIQWGEFSHFNWAEHDRIVMNGGIISPDNAMFNSYAVLAENYANMNLKFGYHFVLVEAICGPGVEENQLRLRFSGGGADIDHRLLRADFLVRILARLEFDVHHKMDLVDAGFVSRDQAETIFHLDMLGRLLGATRLMDMYLKTEDQVAPFVEDFFKGRYHFANDG